jgi:3-oxoacyl-[acyl-carrier-protein] synthase-1
VTQALDVLACGSVTAIGLDAFQTAAAFRAGIAGFRNAISRTPPQEPLRAAKVPARRALRRTPEEWLVRLASRSIREAAVYRPLIGHTGLLLVLPEAVRNHPALASNGAEGILDAVGSAVGTPHSVRALASEGGAGISVALSSARDLLVRGAVDSCLVAAVDSLLNGRDVSRLLDTARMLEPETPQGLVPGEGSACILVALPGRYPGAFARILGIGSATERDVVAGPRYSQGRGFAAALEAAVTDARMPESSVSFRISTVNGERYATWESMFYSTRFYRTRRERLPVWYTASRVGEMGAASGALALALAALSIAGGYAPGPCAMCESASESGLRAACLVGPALDAPVPPFRPEEGAYRRVLGLLHA